MTWALPDQALSYVRLGDCGLTFTLEVIDDLPFTTGTDVMSLAAQQSDISRPSLTLLGIEPWRAAFEFVSHKLSGPRPAPDGDGHPIVIFPGLGTDGSAVAPLRAHCQALGYEAFDWGEGFNTGPQGDVDEWLGGLASRVSTSLRKFDQSATLIGWSLGGLYARELGKLLQAQVRQVITIATPFNATDDHTNAGWLYRMLGGKNLPFDADLSARLKTAPPVPTTSIYSRSDGVVAWQTCLHDKTSDQVQDIEIHGSHIGMGWNKAALQIVGDRLAQAPGQWQPYASDMPLAA
jgi:pimeloyl-ACP methyl ester carboxylesterase